MSWVSYPPVTKKSVHVFSETVVCSWNGCKTRFYFSLNPTRVYVILSGVVTSTDDDLAAPCFRTESNKKYPMWELKILQENKSIFISYREKNFGYSWSYFETCIVQHKKHYNITLSLFQFSHVYHKNVKLRRCLRSKCEYFMTRDKDICLEQEIKTSVIWKKFSVYGKTWTVHNNNLM